MKIAILGTRGIPAAYSGFETCAQELSIRLAERGHEVTVYCRSHAVAPVGLYYRGVRRVTLPSLQNKYLDTFCHTLLSTLHALPQRYDLLLYMGVGNAPFTLLPRLSGTPTLINVDGLDRARDKWNAFARRYLGLCEWLAGRCATHVITDALGIREYYRARYGLETTYIAYGTDIDPKNEEEEPPFGLKRREYILFVGRLVPENRAHELISAYQRVATDLELIIVGDAPYSESYIASLKSRRNPRIRFLGYVFGEPYRRLLRHCALFVLPTAAGGTHPVLVEAMGAGAAILASDLPANIEALGEAGVVFQRSEDGDDLARQLQRLIADPDSLSTFRYLARSRARAAFSWEAVTARYEELCCRHARNRSAPASGREFERPPP
ncbi:MAG: glycosyltransferase [Armatimonadetes bacterium]|nr:glycosyltransferase [Armatimonadota bacterium]